jgi:hypothetical protein
MYTFSPKYIITDIVAEVVKYNVYTPLLDIPHYFQHCEYIFSSCKYFGEPGSSVSTVSGYGIDDHRAIEVRSPAEAKDFSSNPCVQTGSGAYPDSCTMGTAGPIPGAKARPGRDADHSPPSSAEVEN